MSKATIIKGNRVVATADSVKEAKAYAKKVGGLVLVPRASEDAVRASIREAQDAAQFLGWDVVDEICGPGGLSGCTAAEMARLIRRYRQEKPRTNGGEPREVKLLKAFADAAHELNEFWQDHADGDTPDRYLCEAYPESWPSFDEVALEISVWRAGAEFSALPEHTPRRNGDASEASRKLSEWFTAIDPGVKFMSAAEWNSKRRTELPDLDAAPVLIVLHEGGQFGRYMHRNQWPKFQSRWGKRYRAEQINGTATAIYPADELRRNGARRYATLTEAINLAVSNENKRATYSGPFESFDDAKREAAAAWAAALERNGCPGEDAYLEAYLYDAASGRYHFRGFMEPDRKTVLWAIVATNTNKAVLPPARTMRLQYIEPIEPTRPQVSIREAQEAAEFLGWEESKQICGGHGLSSATPAELARLVYHYKQAKKALRN